MGHVNRAGAGHHPTEEEEVTPVLAPVKKPPKAADNGLPPKIEKSEKTRPRFVRRSTRQS